MQELAHSRYPGGNIEWVGGAGNFVAWTDMDREFSDADKTSVWELRVLNLQDGGTWTAASSGGLAKAGAPLFQVSGDNLAWLAPDPGGQTSEIRIADLRTHTVRTILTGAESSILGIDGSFIVYDAADAGTTQADTKAARDIFVVPVSGGATRRISNQHDVTFPSAGGGWAVWGQPGNGDAQQIWAAAIAQDSSPRKVYSGGNVQRVAGQGFIALWTSGTTNLLVVPLSPVGEAGPSVNVDGTPYIPAHFDADRDLLAYATDTDPTAPDDVITLNVAKVVLH